MRIAVLISFFSCLFSASTLLFDTLALLDANNNNNYNAFSIPNTNQNDSPSSPPVTLATINHPPVANAGMNQTVNENTTVYLNGVASDPDPESTLAYSWLQVEGPEVELINGNTTSPSFVSPKIPKDTALGFSLTARDDEGTPSAPAVVTIDVKDANHPPLADAGPDQTGSPGYIISLDATKSRDPDNGSDPLIYSWNQTEGPTVELNDADSHFATFAVPLVDNRSADTNLAFRLTVKDSKNATSTDDVKVTVRHVAPPNKLPVADAGTYKTANEGDIVSLDAEIPKTQMAIY